MEVLIEIKRGWKERKRKGRVEAFEEMRLDKRKGEERGGGEKRVVEAEVEKEIEESRGEGAEG